MPQRTLSFDDDGPEDFLLRLDDLADECEHLATMLEGREAASPLQRRLADAIVSEFEALLDEVADSR